MPTGAHWPATTYTTSSEFIRPSDRLLRILSRNLVTAFSET